MLTNDTSILDRKQASKLLGVSVRTIDRYIRGGKIPAYNKGGRVVLKKKDVLRTTRLATLSQSVPVHVTASSGNHSPKHDGSFYKDLYDEAKKILTEYHQKLEQANYRIGQLETQTTHAPTHQPQPQLLQQAPMQSYMHAPAISMRNEDSITNEFLKKEINDKEKELTLMKNTLKQEQAARTIFAILTYILLATLPALWYFAH